MATRGSLAEQMALLQKRMDRREDRRSKGGKRAGSDDEWEADAKADHVKRAKMEQQVTEKQAAAAAVRAAAAMGGQVEKAFCDLCNFSCPVAEMRSHQNGPVHKKAVARIEKERELSLRGGAGSVAMAQAGWGGDIGRSGRSRAGGPGASAAAAAEEMGGGGEGAPAPAAGGPTELVGGTGGSKLAAMAMRRGAPPPEKKKKKPRGPKVDPFAQKDTGPAVPELVGWDAPMLGTAGGDAGAEDSDEGEESEEGEEEGEERAGGESTPGGLVAYGGSDDDSDDDDDDEDDGAPVKLF